MGQLGDAMGDQRCSLPLLALFLLAAVTQGSVTDVQVSKCTVEGLSECELMDPEKDGRCAHQNSLVACYQHLGCKQEIVILQMDECMNGQFPTDEPKCSESQCSPAPALAGLPPIVFTVLAMAAFVFLKH